MYHAPKARPRAPSAGVRRSKFLPMGPLAMATPNAVERSAIETAVPAAKISSAPVACTAPLDGREQEQRQPARTADPVHQPDTVRRERGADRNLMGVLVGCIDFVRVDVSVCTIVAVAVGVGMEVPAPPANQQPYGEEYYDPPDKSLRGLLHRPWQIASQQHEREPDEDQGSTVPEPPRKAHRAGLPQPVTILLGSDKGGHRGQMVGVGRVPQAEQQADQQHHPESRRPVHKALQPSIYRRHTLSLLHDRLQQPASVVRRFVYASAASSDHKRYMSARYGLRPTLVGTLGLAPSLVSMLRACGPRLSARFEPAALAFSFSLGVGLNGGEYWLVARRDPSAMVGCVVGVRPDSA